MKKYQIVYADPLWDYGNGNFSSTISINTYPLMPAQEIAALPVRDIVDRDAVLFLWATMSQLPSAFQVIEG